MLHLISFESQILELERDVTPDLTVFYSYTSENRYYDPKNLMSPY